ncbi:MAG TPA: peroxiredoxin [Rhizomicrobium sp.]|jgi:peroxiredoxin Q/BCP|nr:peroxiredoxin [Rhizomicrobium sp.]
MRRLAAAVLATALFALPAAAALKPGDAAPDFTAPAALGGKEFTFALADALKKGPVVVYFYPKAFTKGCSLEAHAFAEAMPQFAALGASVIGVSHDDIATLDKFSSADCASKFPVASDGDQHIMKAYDAVLAKAPELANRTSYVVAPDGHVIYEFTDLDYSKHVDNTLAALASWKAAQK